MKKTEKSLLEKLSTRIKNKFEIEEREKGRYKVDLLFENKLNDFHSHSYFSYEFALIHIINSYYDEVSKLDLNDFSNEEKEYLNDVYGIGNNNVRFFVDMDGVLAKFNNQLTSLDPLYEKGYFASLEPQKNVVDVVNKLIDDNVDVYILSAALDSDYAKGEKTEWINKYLPNLKNKKIIFTDYGSRKAAYIPGKIRENDILLDDYTKNLKQWVGGKAIKLVNDINDTNKSWDGDRVYYDDEKLYNTLVCEISLLEEAKDEIKFIAKHKDENEHIL